MKSALRKEYEKKRASLSKTIRESASLLIMQRLITDPHWIDASVVMIYASFGSEVTTDSLIQAALSQGKQILLPGTKDQAYAPILYPSMALPDDHDTPDLIVLPAVACTEHGHRLGRGGGYYDRLLPKYPAAYSIALIFDIQLAPYIPHESHDVSVNLVLTESKSYFSDE